MIKCEDNTIYTDLITKNDLDDNISLFTPQSSAKSSNLADYKYVL